jgi:hypothetical protein
MKEKIIRFVAISSSVLLLAVSVGVIFWIVRDERSRLAERERAAIEAAERATQQELEQAAGESDKGDTEKIFHDINTLIAGLSMDDLPTED